MFCPNCGNQIDDAAQFCTHCGVRIGEETQYAQEDKEPRAKKSSAGRRGLLAALCCCVLALLAVGAAAASIFFRSMKPGEPKTLRDRVTNYAVPGDEIRYAYDEDGNLMFTLAKYVSNRTFTKRWILNEVVLPDGDGGRIVGNCDRIHFFEGDTLVKTVVAPGEDEEAVYLYSDGDTRTYQTRRAPYFEQSPLIGTIFAGEVELDAGGRVVKITDISNRDPRTYDAVYGEEGDITSLKCTAQIGENGEDLELDFHRQTDVKKDEDGKIVQTVWQYDVDKDKSRELVSEISYCTLPEEDTYAGIWELTGGTEDGEAVDAVDSEGKKTFLALSANGYCYVARVEDAEQLYEAPITEKWNRAQSRCGEYQLTEDGVLELKYYKELVDFMKDDGIVNFDTCLEYKLDGAPGDDQIKLSRFDDDGDLEQEMELKRIS